MQSYDYANRAGVTEVSWEEFAAMAARLAELLEASRPEVIVGIARAGLFPATAVACALRRQLFPVRLTRRVGDEVRYERPVWRTPLPAAVAGRRVAVIDEIADTGETLRLVAEAARKARATQVVTATLVSHSWASPPPDVTALTTDAFVIFPWDRRVFVDGEWRPHPEIEAGLWAQSLARGQPRCPVE